HVKHLGEFLRIVAGYHDLVSNYFVENVFPCQQALGQLGIGQGDEGIQLRLELLSLLHAAGYYDPAGSHVQTERQGAVLFRIFHGWSPRLGASWLTEIVRREQYSSQYIEVVPKAIVGLGR